METETISAILDDLPSREDYFDFKSYVNTLKDTILHSETKTPLTIGIFGRWGVGKTTLMCMLEKELKDEKIVTIWFNAWQYSKDESSLWAAFLQTILNKIPSKLNLMQKSIFNIKLLLKRINWKQVPGFFIQYLFKIVIVIVPLLLIDPVTQQIKPQSKYLIQATGGIVAFGLAIWLVLKPIIEQIQSNIHPDLSILFKPSNFKKYISFLDEFHEHFADIVYCLPSRGGKKLVVFIDDLDRCSATQTLEVLNATKLFLDIEGCIYILGLDIEVVRKALATKYEKDLIAQREYLSKIIQLPFYIPPLTRDKMKFFFHRIEDHLPDERCVDVFMAGLHTNPREVKRTINVYSLLWNLATERAELKGFINPIRLAKVVVIQQIYPELHSLLQQKPYLLIDLEQSFLHVPKIDGQQQTNELIVSNENTDIVVPVELSAYVQDENLFKVFFPNGLPKPGAENSLEEFQFENISPEEIAAYFTLTRRVDTTQSPITISSFEYGVNENSVIDEDLMRSIRESRLIIGNPDYWKINDLPKGSTYETLANNMEATFYLLKLTFQVVPEQGTYFTDISIQTETISVESENKTIAIDLYPQELQQGVTGNFSIKVSPDLKLEEFAVPNEIDLRNKAPRMGSEIMCQGKYSSTQLWKFHGDKNYLISGATSVYMIIQKPMDAKGVRLNIKVIANVSRDLLTSEIRNLFKKTMPETAFHSVLICTE